MVINVHGSSPHKIVHAWRTSVATRARFSCGRTLPSTSLTSLPHLQKPFWSSILAYSHVYMVRQQIPRVQAMKASNMKHCMQVEGSACLSSHLTYPSLNFVPEDLETD